jgi:hypothetical protein
MTGWRFLFPTLPHLTLCITTFTFYPINWEFNGVLVYVCNTWGSQGRVPGLRRRLWPLATAVPRPPHLYTKSSLRLFRIHPHPQHRCWEGLHFHLAWATPACWAVDRTSVHGSNQCCHGTAAAGCTLEHRLWRTPMGELNGVRPWG